MTRNPYPMLEQVTKVIPPGEMLRMDLDDPAVWTRPDIDDYRYLGVHWGGGPNQAGTAIEEPGLTPRQKMAVQLGRVKSVLKVWEGYHIGSRGMSAIAYCTWADPLYGRIGRLRGHRWNGGQWGSQNGICHAFVFVLGFGQKPRRRGWRSLGLVWFCSGGPEVVPHRFFNDWPQTKGPTSCPGDDIAALIHSQEYVKALGKLRWATPYPKGVRVRAITLKLTELAFLGGIHSRYTREVRDAVAAFQQAYRVPADKPGVVGAETWKALAAA